MIGAQIVLKCILLAKFQTIVLEAPVDEYASANINRVHNGFHFVGNVFEGKINFVMIENVAKEIKTMSFSYRGNEQRSLSTKLDIKNEQATLDCELN